MFVDVSGAAPREQNKWPSIVIPKEAIDLEIARLIDAPRPDNGRRASLIVHPQATAPGLGLAPGTDVTINVVNPGERTFNLRKNSNMLEICISGEGVATVAGRDIAVSRWDVWNTPAMQVHSYRNEGNTPWVRLSYSNAPLLEKLNEHGEIKAGTMAEAREAYKIETWAKKIGITRQVLVNDDIGAFSDLARRMGQGAAETEARILVTLLEANSGAGPTLSDTKTLFHVDHGNKAAIGAVISDATLSAARLALRTQKGLDGRIVRVTPKNLLVPPALETVAEKWQATIAPATAADVNPFSGAMSLVVEPRLSSATRWYVTADPGEIDGLEFAYLSGNEGPQVESRSGWDVDGVEIRVILDFGAGFIDHRGWFQNAGA